MRKIPTNLRAILFLLLIGCVPTAFSQENEDEIIRVETSLVTVPVIVSDRQNRYISGLKASDFTVFRDGQKQTIDYFAAEESPINVAILLDTSRSAELVLGKIQKAAMAFVKLLKPNDRASVISFDADVNVLTELTGDRDRLKKSIKDAEIGERYGTVLRDAVERAVTRSFKDVKGRKAVIVLTDGKDFGSNTRVRELIYRLQESDALVYTVFYDTALINQAMVDNNRFPFPNRRGGMNRPNRFPERRRQRAMRSNEEAMDFLREMSEVSAGRFYETKVTDISDAFEAIAEELRRQYLIGFYPEKIEPGKTYSIRLKVAREDAVVRAKSAFRVREKSN